jgi:arylsulfatase A-like enzyme
MKRKGEMSVNRRQSMSMAALGVMGLSGVALATRKPAARPRAVLKKPTTCPLNILLIVSDQERAWHMYPAGFIEKHAPARAWLANNGVSFTNAHTPTPICSTARGVIYTGAHSPNNMVWDNVPFPLASPLRPDIATLGSMFVDAGYRTGYAGKWHLSHLDTKLAKPDPQVTRDEIKSYGFEETEVASEIDGPQMGFLNDEATVNSALTFIGRNKGQDRPWFQAVNLVNPHDIMYYTSGDAMTASRVSQFPDKSVRPPSDPLYGEDLGYLLTPNTGPASFGTRPNAVIEYGKTFSAAMGTMPYDDEAACRDMQNYYWNCTRDGDRQLSKLIEGVRQAGELDHTIIVFMADHGELLGAHGLRGKGTTPLREAVNVPLVFVHPAGPKGVSTDALVSHVDLAPTLLGLAGVDTQSAKEQLPSVVGRDYSKLVLDPSGIAPRAQDGLLFHWTSFAFLDHRSVTRFNQALGKDPVSKMVELSSILRDSTQRRGLMRGSMNDRYKFARYFSPRQHETPLTWDDLIATNDIELYDIVNDPGETTNLATDLEKHKSTLIAMNALTNALSKAEIGTDDGTFMPFLARH